MTRSASPVLLPGATIGIFGGGQLGRLTAIAARSMGYRIHVLDPDPGCPARFVVDQCVEADWTDAREAARLARGCDVVTLEIEQISLASLNAAASYAPVRPGEQVLEVIQDRIVQKEWLARNGFPIGPWRAVSSLDELRAAVAELGGKCFCKSATGGYDGRGQGKVGFNSQASDCHSDAEHHSGEESPQSPASASHSERSEESPHLSPSACHSERSEESPHLPASACHSERSEESPYLSASACHSERSEESPYLSASACHSERSEESPYLPLSEKEILGAWEALGKGPGVVEQAIDLDREISVMVARSPRGEVQVYPAAWNHHENQILAWSVLPAPLPEALAAEARALAESIADSFLLEGILAVELFVTKSGRLLVNELAPRPHNSYHASERACVTSQFEQLVRAVCNLPLGSPAAVQPCAIANLLGDLWLAPRAASDPARTTDDIEHPMKSAANLIAQRFCVGSHIPAKEEGAFAPGALLEPRTSNPGPRFDRALAVPGVRLHLYEKLRPRKGRKMGHLSAVAPTPEEAVALVLKAQALL